MKTDRVFGQDSHAQVSEVSEESKEACVNREEDGANPQKHRGSRQGSARPKFFPIEPESHIM